MNRQQSVSHTLANATHAKLRLRASKQSGAREAWIDFFFGLSRASARLPAGYSLIIAAVAVFRCLMIEVSHFRTFAGVRDSITAFVPEVIFTCIIVVLSAVSFVIVARRHYSNIDTKTFTMSRPTSSDSQLFTNILVWLLPIHNYIVLPKLLALLLVRILMPSSMWNHYGQQNPSNLDWLCLLIGALMAASITIAYFRLVLMPFHTADYFNASSQIMQLAFITVLTVMLISSLLAHELADTASNGVFSFFMACKMLTPMILTTVVRSSTFFNISMGPKSLEYLTFVVSTLVAIVDTDINLSFRESWSSMGQGVHILLGAGCTAALVLLRNMTPQFTLIKNLRQCFRFGWLVYLLGKRSLADPTLTRHVKEELVFWITAAKLTLVSRGLSLDEIDSMSIRQLLFAVFAKLVHNDSSASDARFQMLWLLSEFDEGITRTATQLVIMKRKCSNSLRTTLAIMNLQFLLAQKLTATLSQQNGINTQGKAQHQQANDDCPRRENKKAYAGGAEATTSLAQQSLDALEAHQHLEILCQIMKRHVLLLYDFYVIVNEARPSARLLHELAKQTSKLVSQAHSQYQLIRRHSDDSTFGMMSYAHYLHLTQNKNKESRDVGRLYVVKKKQLDNNWRKRTIASNLQLGSACIMSTPVTPSEIGNIIYSAGTLIGGVPSNLFNLISPHLAPSHAVRVNHLLSTGQTMSGRQYINESNTRLLRLNNTLYIASRVTVGLNCSVNTGLQFVTAVETGNAADTFLVTDETECVVGVSVGLHEEDPCISTRLVGRKIKEILATVLPLKDKQNLHANYATSIANQSIDRFTYKMQYRVRTATDAGDIPNSTDLPHLRLDMMSDCRSQLTSEVMTPMQARMQAPNGITVSESVVFLNTGLRQALSYALNSQMHPAEISADAQSSHSLDAMGDETAVKSKNRDKKIQPKNNGSLLKREIPLIPSNNSLTAHLRETTNTDVGGVGRKDSDQKPLLLEKITVEKEKKGIVKSILKSNYLSPSDASMAGVAKHVSYQNYSRSQSVSQAWSPRQTSSHGEEKFEPVENEAKNFKMQRDFDEGSSLATSMKISSDRVKISLTEYSPIHLLKRIMLTFAVLMLALTGLGIAIVVVPYNSFVVAARNLDTMRFTNPLMLQAALYTYRALSSFMQYKFSKGGYISLDKFSSVDPTNSKIDVEERARTASSQLRALSIKVLELVSLFSSKGWGYVHFFVYKAMLPVTITSTVNQTVIVRIPNFGNAVNEQFRLLMRYRDSIEFNSTVYRQTVKFYEESIIAVAQAAVIRIIMTDAEEYMNLSKSTFKKVVILVVSAGVVGVLLLALTVWFAMIVTQVYECFTALEDGEILFKKERLEHFDRWLNQWSLRAVDERVMPSHEKISVFNRMVSRGVRAKRRSKIQRPMLYFFNDGWIALIYFVILIVSGVLFVSAVSSIRKRRDRQLDLVVRHRLNSKNYYVFASIQQLIYDAIIIKAGLRTDVPLAKQLGRLSTVIEDEKKHIDLVRKAYLAVGSPEETAAFPSFGWVANPCESPARVALTKEACAKIGYGSFNRGMMNLYTWQLYTAENMLGELNKTQTNASLWRLLQNQDWVQYEYIQTYLSSEQYGIINESFQASVKSYFGNYETWLWNMVYIYQAVLLVLTMLYIVLTIANRFSTVAIAMSMLGSMPSASLVLNNRLKKLLIPLRLVFS